MATELDMIAGSQLRDTQGEVLDVAGCDISELQEGRGYINDGHSNKLPDVLGRVTFAKKIFGPQDCDDDRQRYFWNKVKAPYIYVKAKLFDDEGDHRSAKAAAAILRHQHREDSPLKLKASVEGGIIERGDKDERLLKRTKLKGVALTFTPANNATLVEGVNLKKSSSWEADEPLIKSLIPLAQTDVPSFIEVADAMSEAKIRRNIEKIREMVGELAKGSLQRRMPFNPKDVSTEEKEASYDWVGGGVQEAKEDLANMGMDPNARSRALLKLHGVTKVRVNKDGDREFLLHRGMSNKEARKHIKKDMISHDKASSWTPNKDVAEGFADGYDGKVVSAWINENNIRHIPKQIGSVSEEGDFAPKAKGPISAEEEYEVILGPHKSALAKALTAGYGGGSPTSATGGQVLQTEAIDTKGGRDFKYIECPSCGKEQPYMRYQVRCRSCSKAFPMDSLAKFFIEDK